MRYEEAVIFFSIEKLLSKRYELNFSTKVDGVKLNSSRKMKIRLNITSWKIIYKNNILLVIFSIFLSFFPFIFSAQEKKNVEIDPETNEPIFKVDKKWVDKLDKLDDKKEKYDNTLKEDVFQQRFALLDANTQLSIDYNSITFGYVKKYLSYSWYYKIIGLSVYYFPLFESSFEKYGIPKELKYLAVVESALNPRAGSWAGAGGIWQFMPATGGNYGLHKNNYYNGFYDVVKSTDAAARYLRDAYKQLGDWNLAISSYNCGVGNVRKAISKAGSRSYWKVRPYLPKETQAYVPSFIAVNYMFNFYKLHGIKPMYFKYNFYDIRMVINHKTTTFQKIGGDTAFLRFANPQFTSDIIPANSIIYTK